MAGSTLFRNAMVFVDGYDITGQLNQVALDYGAEALDATVFGNTSRQFKGGLKDASVTGRGFYTAGTGPDLIDPVLVDGVGVSDTVLTLFPDGITEGSTSTGSGFMFKTVQTKFSPGGAVGELYAFDYEVKGRGVSA